MANEFDPFEDTIVPVEPEIITPKDETPLALQEDMSEDDMKKQAMAKVRQELDSAWIDLDYLLTNMKDAVENATIETFSGTLLKDHKTSVSALKQLIDLWKTAHWMNKKEAQEIIFKPIFNKPPKLN